MPSEKKIIALKYSAPRFGEMDDDTRGLSATKCLLTIAAITGWTIPASSQMMEILAEQFSKKLQESYVNLNLEEVEYAFRNKGLDVKDWGKALNLEMIDLVLVPYLENRADLSMQEEKISTQLQIEEEQKKLVSAPMSDQEWEEWLLDISKYQLNKIPCDSFDYLVRTKKIILNPNQKHALMDRAIMFLFQTTDPLTREGSDFLKMKNAGVYSASVTATLITTSKRLAVFDFFNSNNV